MKKIATFLVAVLAMVGLAACNKKTTTTTTKATTAASTAAPTTVAPTTVAPTTIAPTTKAPTTVAPTTKAPTTVAPTTVAPTTAAPTTAAPTTVAPTTTQKQFPNDYVNGSVVYSNDFNAIAAGTAVANAWDGNATSVNGICFGNSGSAAAADNTATYNGSALVINDQDKATAGKEGQLAIALPNDYSLGKVTIYMEVRIVSTEAEIKIPGGWSPIQIYGTTSAGKSGNAILGIRTNNKPSGSATSPYAFSYEGAAPSDGADAANFKNSTIPYYHVGEDTLVLTFTMDFENDVASCVINGQTLNIINFASKSVNFVKFITKSSVNLQMTIDNFAVGFEAPDFATYQPKIMNELQNYFNTNKGNYTTNIVEYTQACNAGQAEITDATTSLGVKAAYDAAVAAMEAILNDVDQAQADLEAYILEVKTNFENAYAAYDVDNNYTVNKAAMENILAEALDPTADENTSITASTDKDSVDMTYEYFIEELEQVKSDAQLDAAAALVFDGRIAELPDPATLTNLSTKPAFDSLMAEINEDLDVKALLSTASTTKITATEEKYTEIYNALPANEKLAIDKTNGKAVIDIEYAKYDLTEYTINANALLSIANTAKADIDAATESSAIDAIIEKAALDMADVLDDDAQEAANFANLPITKVGALIPQVSTLSVTTADECGQGLYAGTHSVFTFVGSKWQVDANPKSIDGIDYTHRIKSGGTGSITFTVNNNGASLYIAAMSSSKNTVRTAALSKGGVGVGTDFSNDGNAIGSTIWSDLTAGEYTITLAAGFNFYCLKLSDKTGSFVDASVTEINVTTNPTKVEYQVGETIDLAGMVVTATCKKTIDATEESTAITEYTTDASTIDMTTTGTKTITVSYTSTGKGTVTTTFEISVISMPL